MKHIDTKCLGASERRKLISLLAVAVAVLVLSACSGGGSGNDDEASATEASAEKQLLDYVTCLRGQGLDVPDPQVDADGNLKLNPDQLFPGGDGQQPSQAEIDAFSEKYQAAQKVCGSPPQGAVGGTDHNQTGFQDALVAFARCMREKGVDIADPDFSSPGGQGKFFSEFHRIQSDPAFEPCQQKAFAGVQGGG